MVIYSHSRISTFEQCPLKFKFRYIDKIPPDFEQSIEGFLGNKVHDTLEWIYKKVAQNIIPQLDDVIQYYVNNWDRDYNYNIRIVKEDLNSQYYFHQVYVDKNITQHLLSIHFQIQDSPKNIFHI